jgi:hypothetical protein
MGTSDHYAVPVIIFSVTYMGFLIFMLGSFGAGYLIQQSLTGAEGMTTSGTGWSWDNVIFSISVLGVWNTVFFAPVVVALLYIFGVLVIPVWV